MGICQENADAVREFSPFTDTVVIFDYVLGQEQLCAETITAYLERFYDSPYKLRILLLERHRRTTDDDWMLGMKRGMGSEARLEFEAGSYREQALNLGKLGEEDELVYTENYLEGYLPLLEKRNLSLTASDTDRKRQKRYKKAITIPWQQTVTVHCI